MQKSEGLYYFQCKNCESDYTSKFYHQSCPECKIINTAIEKK